MSVFIKVVVFKYGTEHIWQVCGVNVQYQLNSNPGMSLPL